MNSPTLLCGDCLELMKRLKMHGGIMARNGGKKKKRRLF